jgi:hypothetical protein
MLDGYGENGGGVEEKGMEGWEAHVGPIPPIW